VDERREKRPLAAGSSERADHSAFQSSEIIRREVREVGVLRVAPHGFHRVEVGRVGGQPLDDGPTVLEKPSRHAGCPGRPMPIPDEGEAALIQEDETSGGAAGVFLYAASV